MFSTLPPNKDKIRDQVNETRSLSIQDVKSCELS